MREPFPKIVLPTNFLFTANHSGNITAEQIAKIKRYKPESSRYSGGFWGILSLICSGLAIVMRSSDMFDMMGYGWKKITFPIIVGLVGVYVFYFLVQECLIIRKEIRSRILIIRDLRQCAVRTAEGILGINSSNSPGIQITGNFLHIMPYPANTPYPLLESYLRIEPGKKYRVHYLERSGIALSAEELGTAETESFGTYHLAFAGQYNFDDLARNRIGKLAGSQRRKLLSGIAGYLFGVVVLLFISFLMAPLLSSFMKTIPPHTFIYFVCLICLQILPALAVGTFCIVATKELLLVFADLVCNRARTCSGCLIKPFDVTEKELAQSSFRTKIEIDGRIIRTKSAVYKVLQEGDFYTAYFTCYSTNLLSIETSPSPSSIENE